MRCRVLCGSDEMFVGSYGECVLVKARFKLAVVERWDSFWGWVLC